MRKQSRLSLIEAEANQCIHDLVFAVQHVRQDLEIPGALTHPDLDVAHDILTQVRRRLSVVQGTVVEMKLNRSKPKTKGLK